MEGGWEGGAAWLREVDERQGQGRPGPRALAARLPDPSRPCLGPLGISSNFSPSSPLQMPTTPLEGGLVHFPPPALLVCPSDPKWKGGLQL